MSAIKPTRRTIVASLAAAPVLSTTVAVAWSNSPDSELLALGRRLESNQAALGHASGGDEIMGLLDSIETLSAAIVKTPANSLQGLYVKARATAWALEHDCGLLDPENELALNERVAASIVRDLLRLGAPDA